MNSFEILIHFDNIWTFSFFWFPLTNSNGDPCTTDFYQNTFCKFCILSYNRKVWNGCRPRTEIAAWRPPNPSYSGSSIRFDTVWKPTSVPRQPQPADLRLAISCWTCASHWWRRYWWYGSSRAPSCTWRSTNTFRPMWNDAQ